MPFSDDLRAVIADVRAEHDREEKDLLAFNHLWRHTRNSIVEPILSDAVSVLKSSDRPAVKDYHKESIILKFSVIRGGESRTTLIDSLILSPSHNTRSIIVETQSQAITESIPIDELDQDRMESIVRNFVRHAERAALTQK